MKKYSLILLLLLAALATTQAQIAFGPYLTYGGSVNDVGQMTVQFGVAPDDTRTYYVVYWNKDSTTTYCKPIINSKIVNRRSERGIGNENVKCKIWWITLKGLAQGGTYQYFVSEYFDFSLDKIFGSLKFTAAKSISDSDFGSQKALVLVNKAQFTGKINGTNREVYLLPQSSIGFNTSYVPLGNNLKVSILDKQRVYNFKVPKDNDTTLSCFVISDTQDNADGNQVFPAMAERLKNGFNASFILHGGDFVDWDDNTISKLSAYNTGVYAPINNSYLFGSVPLQVTEGNHDRGYLYNAATSLVNSDNESNFASNPQKFTKENIWFDKYYQYNYAGLNNSVRYENKVVVQSDLYSHYYSFDWGPVHVCVLDFTTLSREYSKMPGYYAEKQLKWLLSDLDKTKKKWKILLTHYKNVDIDIDKFDTAGVKAGANVSAVIDAIVYSRGVHLVIDGHQHKPTEIDDEFFYKISHYSENISSKAFLQMRIPIGSSTSDSENGKFSYFTFNFIGSKLIVKQFSGQNNSSINQQIGIDRTFRLDSKLTIVEQ